MKKILLISLFLCTIFCGCNRLYFEPEQTVIISAVGIDTVGESLLVTLETVDTSLSDENSEYSPKTLEMTAKDCGSAFKKLQKTLGNKISCQHCVFVVKGESVSEELFFEALLYLRENENLSQNTKIATSKSANNLLNTKSKTGQAVGFDAVKILNLSEDKSALINCNLYSVLKGKDADNAPALPVFKTANGGYFLEGMENE